MKPVTGGERNQTQESRQLHHRDTESTEVETFQRNVSTTSYPHTQGGFTSTRMCPSCLRDFHCIVIYASYAGIDRLPCEDASMVKLAKEPNYYTVGEAAKLLKVSPSTIWRWIDAGQLPAYRAGARTIRISAEDLLRFMRPTKDEEMSSRQESRSTQTELTIEPLNDVEVQRGLEAIQQARDLREAMRTSRGGIPVASSLPLIQQAREERLKQRR
jgi:excisionase family DNA binding protein